MKVGISTSAARYWTHERTKCKPALYINYQKTFVVILLNVTWGWPCAVFALISLPSCPISVCPLSSACPAVSACPMGCCSVLLSSPVHILPTTALAPLNSKFFVFSEKKKDKRGEYKCLWSGYLTVPESPKGLLSRSCHWCSIAIPLGT